MPFLFVNKKDFSRFYRIRVPKVLFRFFDKLKYEIRNKVWFRFYTEVETENIKISDFSIFKITEH